MSKTNPLRTPATAPRGCTNFKLRQLLRRVSRIYDAELARVGLKGTQYSLLSHLVSMSPIAPGELARRMDMDPSTLTRNVRLLVDQGWVERAPGCDTRSHHLAITARGRAKHAEAKAHWKRAQLTVNAQLGGPQVATLHTLIDGALVSLHEIDDLTAEA
ncbi:MAG: MarR family winged helix-turn-helix transcriptional regulator [Gammaproteobacteria bacterium]|jgi:DNA-binding MarR family transcriptional regulator